MSSTSTPTPRLSSLDLDGFQPLDIAHAARSPRPELDFVIPNLLVGTVAVMVGPGGVSKSMLALQTAAVVATGSDHWSLWTEKETVPAGRVVVFNVEDPAIILQTRVHDIAQSKHLLGNGREGFIDAFDENVSILPLVGRGFAFGRKLPRTGRIMPTEWIEWVEAQVVGCRLAIFDTFIRGLDGLDENSSTDVAPVLAMLEGICRRQGCAFLILHHVSKSAVTNAGIVSQQAARGSSALTDNARWQTNLATMTDAQAEARGILPDARKRWVSVDLTKGNYGPPIEGRWLYRGDGGVLDGGVQPPVIQASGKVRKANNGGSDKVAYIGDRRSSRMNANPFAPDEIDLQVEDTL